MTEREGDEAPLFESAEREYERVLAEFDRAWRYGPRPEIVAFRQRVEETRRREALVDLIFIDIERAAKAGLGPRVEDYVATFPELVDDAAVLLELVSWEIEVRGRLGELVRVQSCVERFPNLKDSLAERFAGRDLASDARSDTHDPAPVAGPSGLDVLDVIGRGGIGVVHRGRDTEIGRELAIKVLREDRRNDPEIIRRFVDEARIAGRLEHPGIAPVHRIGWFPDGRPFFAMKLIRGRTLAELLADRRAEAPRLLGIFEAVCQTMAYVHASGVIHRDLKPSNVMVGSFGEVQVMDWGFAKVLSGRETTAAGTREPGDVSGTIADQPAGRIDHSEPGQVMGTLPYMSPEQARGDIDQIDERADVFALGSILCEILTGAPAYDWKVPAELHRMAATGDLADALTRLDACEAEAELVALAKASLSPEWEARPRDAREVSARMTSYLTGVQARLRAAELARAAEEARASEAIRTAEQAQAKARAERMARRLTASLAASVLAVAVLAMAAWRWFEAEQNGRTQKLITRVESAVADAIQLRGRAQGAAAGDLIPWVEAEAAARKANELMDPSIPATLRLRTQTLLAAIAAEYRRAEESLAASARDRALLDHVVDIRSAEVEDRDGSVTDSAYGEAFREANLDVEALAPAEAAARIRARPPAVVASIVATLDDWASLKHARRGDHRGMDQLYKVMHAVGLDPWHLRLHAASSANSVASRKLALASLAQPEELERLDARSIDLLARRMTQVGASGAAESVLRTGVRLHPHDAWINFDLGRLLSAQKRRDEAIRFYTAARAILPATSHELAHALNMSGHPDDALSVFQELVRIRPESNRHLTCYGILLKSRGRQAEAMAVLRRAVANLETQARRSPQDALGRLNLAIALAECGRRSESIERFTEAVQLRPQDPHLHAYLGRALSDAGRLQESIAALRESVRLNPRGPAFRQNLGQALLAAKKNAEALSEYREAVRYGSDDAVAHFNYATCLATNGRPSEAIEEYRAALRVNGGAESSDQQAVAGTTLDVVTTHAALARLLIMQGEVGEGVIEAREAVRLDGKSVQAHLMLGFGLLRQGDMRQAVDEYSEAVRLQPENLETRIHLVRLLLDADRLDDAIKQCREGTRRHPEDVVALTHLGRTLRLANRLDEAADVMATALRLDPKHGWARQVHAWILLGKGDLEGAIRGYRAAIQLGQSNDSAAHHELGMALEQSGDAEAAIAEYRQAIRLKPNHAGYRLQLGTILASRRQTDEAMKALRESIRLDPKSAPAHRQLGELLVRDGLLAESLEHFEVALRADRKEHGEPSGDRLEALRAATSVVFGKSSDDHPLQQRARARILVELLDRLNKEKARWMEMVGSGRTEDRTTAVRLIAQARELGSLAGVRDPMVVSSLEEKTRTDWRRFWSDLDALESAAGSGQR